MRDSVYQYDNFQKPIFWDYGNEAGSKSAELIAWDFLLPIKIFLAFLLHQALCHSRASLASDRGSIGKTKSLLFDAISKGHSLKKYYPQSDHGHFQVLHRRNRAERNGVSYASLHVSDGHPRSGSLLLWHVCVYYKWANNVAWEMHKFPFWILQQKSYKSRI